ncbi:DUF2169 domain-containing protein [Colwellia sp. MB02u-10]|uniref:DUF2169 family type VI secretion system accessory protein n=1 Tax=Colwellia sp. MB02u-10 TaxID=2759828 RepID=UPI0015F5F1FD|nr:DUF2169 domain-containing protein [Colwellia sp. MB02u-10]MBA6339758.1 DUF2169 domain-containing protein [Colwellia sp. MB02u-10]
MQIIKPLQLAVLHKSFTYLEKDVFAVSIPIAFSMVDGEILLEQKLWEMVGEQIGDDIFDAAMPKTCGEVLVAGDFIAPHNKSVAAGSVHLKISRQDQHGQWQAQVDKELAVFGDRRWYKLLGAGIGISSAEPFSSLTINYSNAYGGEGYAFNPEGKGFKTVETELGERQFLPNIEYKNNLLTSSSKQAAPASFGRIDIMWQQRLSLAGTYDQAYLDNQMPGLANDIDWLYFNDAAQDQWLKGFFQGDEHFYISHMHAQHQTLSGTLPAIYGRAFVNQSVPVKDEQQQLTGDYQTEFTEIKTKLDTLWLFPNAAVGVMIYRGTIEGYSDDGCDISALLLACENRSDTPRSLAHYQDQLTKRLDPEHGYKYALFSSPLIAEGMSCGFKQIQDEYDFPLEMLGKANMDEFAKAKTAEAMLQVDDAKQQIIEQCKAAGVDPTPYIDKINNPEKAPEQLKIEALMEKMAPGMVTDPENIDIFNIDLSVMDEIKAYTEEMAEQKKAEAKAQVKAEAIKLKTMPDAHLFIDAIAKMEKAVIEIDLPPMWPRTDISGQLLEIKKQVANATKQIEVLREQGVPEEQLPNIALDIENIEAKLLDAEVRLKETYAMGAHLMPTSRSPHPEQEVALKTEFLQKLNQGESLVNGDYACIDLSGENLAGIDLTGCYLEGVNFTDCDLTKANLTGAILAGANLTNANLTQANCAGANIGAANLTDADLSEANLTKGQLGGSNLTRTKLMRCDMAELNFLDTTFEQTVFDGAVLKQCNFINPVFNHCSFIGSDLSQVNMVKPILVQANFSQATLDGANFVEAQANDSNFSQAQMINSRFVGGCQLNNSNFTGANLSQSCLRENQLNECDFSNAQLAEADFSGAELANSKFVGAKAYRTQFHKSQCKNADMRQLNLMEGSLYKAYLVGAKFDGANLYCVNFLDCTLGDNSYKDANLDQTILKDWRP